MARIPAQHLKYLEFGDSIKVRIREENGKELEARGKLVGIEGGEIRLVGYSIHDPNEEVRALRLKVKPGTNAIFEVSTTKIFGSKRKKVMEILNKIKRGEISKDY